METTIKLELPEDFETLCSIYQIRPESFIQTFIDQVSLPGYYSRPNDKDRWGTLFFLQFLEVSPDLYEVNRELEEQYLEQFNRAMEYNFEANLAHSGKSLITGRDIMQQWLKATLAERAKYLTDSL